VFSQGIVGWHAATDRRTDLVMTPLRIAQWDRDRQGCPVKPGQLPHHGDAGSQRPIHLDPIHRTSSTGKHHPSIGTVGDAYDNGLMESIIGLYTSECIATTVFHDGPYKTLADIEYATAGWIDWYNHRRLHGSLRMLTPTECGQHHYAAHSREPQPT
jgi:putative transposase